MNAFASLSPSIRFQKSLKFENGAEFEMVHKDDVVDEKEFEAVLNEAAEVQEELGKEVDAMLSLESADGSGGGT